jgi:lipopolysaccharide transport protein LptA
MKVRLVLAFSLLVVLPWVRPAVAESAADKKTPTQMHSDQPISINADDLEAVMQKGQRKFLFRKNVVVVQGEMTLHTDALEAFYPEGSSDPDRLVATGNVIMEQEGRTLTCDHATYVRAEDRLICEGRAVMVSGEDRLSGDKIDVLIESGVVKASGKVQVNVMPKDSEGKGSAGGKAP